jgi:vitamin B12 transporter
MKVLWLISFWGCVITSVLAQQADDTVTSYNFRYIVKQAGDNPGTVRINLPLRQAGSLADAVSQYSALFVKFYSPVGLATTSMRGMAAQHTAILWNGLNLQSSMNGVIDLNLLPVFFLEQAVVETGANASASANGAIAGAIYLDNRMARQKSVFADVQYGSFNYKSYGGGFSGFYRKWTFKTRILYKSSDNDFEFANYFKIGKPIEKLQHGRFEQYGAMQEIGFSPAKHHAFYLNAWHLQTHRQLPPPMGASSLHEKQDDINTRILLRHEWQVRTGWSVVNKLAFLDEKIDYFADGLKPAYSEARTAIAESAMKLVPLKNFEFSASLNYTSQWAFADGYPQGKQRHLLSLMARLDWKNRNGKLRLSLADRQLLANGVMVPSSPDFGMAYQVNKILVVKGNAAYSYRIPSFNDLYWSQGGNPGLRPERGKKAEISSDVAIGEFRSSITAFYHRVNNWIIWLPDPQTNIWRANNAREVESKGVEVSAEYGYRIAKKHAARIFGRYQYVNSINTKVYAEDITALGKQLAYIPVHTGFARFQYSFSRLQFHIGAIYNGSRFTTSDNNRDYQLPAYMTLQTGLSYELRYKQHSGLLALLVNNLGNSTYQVMENRPMPLRNYQLNLKINIDYDKN